MTNSLQSSVFTGNEIIPPEPRAMMILLHGLGSNADDLISLVPMFQQLLPPNVAYLSPNAPEPFQPMPFNAYQWFSLGNYNPAEQNFHSYLPQWRESIKTPLPQLLQFLTEQQSRFNIPSEQTALLGFSQGAMMSLAVSATHRLGAVISCSGALLSEPDFTTTTLPPYLLLHGEADEVVPCEASRQATEFLQNLNASATLHTYADLAHSINEQGIATAASFMKKHIAIA